MTEQTRVLLADDHAVLRQGLRVLLDAEPDFHVVAEASDGAEAVSAALATDIDLAILDVSMPRLTGIQAATNKLQELDVEGTLTSALQSVEECTGIGA